MTAAATKWDTQYEWKAVTLLAIGFGLVGLDRCIILPLFPVIMKDLGLDYRDIGYISGALAIAWGVAALFMGGISDRIGRRRVLIPSVIGFSLLAGLTGVAGGVGSLLLIRALMGLCEGAYTPASIAATLEASKASRRGFNLGLQQQAFPLLGLALAPILATQLLEVLPSWRWVFVIVSVPGFVVAWLMYRVLRDTHAGASRSALDPPPHRWTEALRHRNVALNCLVMLCLLTCIFVVGAMMPSYLTDFLRLELDQMGFVLSAVGFGGFAGQLVLPGLSDRYGRKPIMIFSFLTAGLCMWMLMDTGPDPMTLFALLFVASGCLLSMTCLTVGPLTTEAVPPALMSTATGLVVGIGEVFGGGIMPALAGFVAQGFGIQYILHLALGGLVVGVFVALLLEETAPVRRKQGAMVIPAENQV
jgi:MFS family permease